MDFFTSDPHFGHRNIIQYCNRPFGTLQEMDEGLIQRWNAVVGPDDTVYVLGDVSFYGAGVSKDLVSQLNGHKKLVKGNHDRGDVAMLNMGFETVTNRALVTFPNDKCVLMVHDPEYALQDPDLLSTDLVLCGHVHDHWRTKLLAGVRFVNVGVDVWDYRPVTLEELLLAPTMVEPEGADRHAGKAYL